MPDHPGNWVINFDSSVRWLHWPNPGTRVTFQISETPEKPDWWDVDLRERAAGDLEHQPRMVRRKGFPSRPIPDHTGHSDVLRIAKSWLRNCDEFHKSKRLGDDSPGWEPKRLIDLSDPKAPCLIDRNDLGPPRNARYAALSHCWGPNPSFLTLRAENLDQFRRCINLPDLPASFCDAVSVCAALDIRYLWIDSLCILQWGDSSEDD